MALLAPACGGNGGASALRPPPTTAATIPSSPTVPPLGQTPKVLPAIPANATANADGACSRFWLLYIRLPQGPVSTATAHGFLGAAQQFAAAAATASPAQWGQLRADLDGLAALAETGTWQGTTSQITLPQVRAVYADCHPLQ